MDGNEVLLVKGGCQRSSHAPANCEMFGPSEQIADTKI